MAAVRAQADRPQVARSSRKPPDLDHRAEDFDIPEVRRVHRVGVLGEHGEVDRGAGFASGRAGSIVMMRRAPHPSLPACSRIGYLLQHLSHHLDLLPDPDRRRHRGWQRGGGSHRAGRLHRQRDLLRGSRSRLAGVPRLLRPPAVPLHRGAAIHLGGGSSKSLPPSNSRAAPTSNRTHCHPSSRRACPTASPLQVLVPGGKTSTST